MLGLWSFVYPLVPVDNFNILQTFWTILVQGVVIALIVDMISDFNKKSTDAKINKKGENIHIPLVCLAILLVYKASLLFN